MKKQSRSFFLDYAPAWGLVTLIVLLFVCVTLPSIRMNKYLNRVRAQRFSEMDQIRSAENRLMLLKQALEKDPITIENQLRKNFSGARRKGELGIDRFSQ